LHALAQQEFQNKEVRGSVARSEHPSSLSLGIWPVTRRNAAGQRRKGNVSGGMAGRGKVSSSKFLPTDESRDTVELERKLGCHKTGKTKWSQPGPLRGPVGALPRNPMVQCGSPMLVV
jgi:hypothetical protein